MMVAGLLKTFSTQVLNLIYFNNNGYPSNKRNNRKSFKQFKILPQNRVKIEYLQSGDLVLKPHDDIDVVSNN